MKLAILGDPFVGKTSLRRRYLGESFSNNYVATIGADFSVKQIKLDTTPPTNVRTAIWDIAGQANFQQLAPEFYKGAQGIFIVYDVTNPESYHQIPNWLDQFMETTSNTSTPVVIIGNKIDLEESVTGMEQLSMIQNLSSVYPDNPFHSFRTSVKTGEHVDEAFSTLISSILEKIKEDNNTSTQTTNDLNLWDFSDRYIPVEFVQCRNCELFIEMDDHQLKCPHCNKVMVVKNRFTGYRKISKK